MEIMKKALFILVFFSIAFLATALLKMVYFSIPFEYVAKYKAEDIEKMPIWFSVRDKKYSGFFDEELLSEHCVGYRKDELDLENYTYIVTCGHKLKEISYSFCETKNRKLLFIPKQYVGRVILYYEENSYIYIYKVKKIDIDCDYHDRNKNVYFTKFGDTL